ncbi:MAG TPA: ADP-ribosylglycohydrolase family protein [bacterium]|nr:ADP-ribosylglycohydrolase family protein [bacterium]
MNKNQIISAFFGFCVGDAVGLPVRFSKREDLKKNPVLTMREYGEYNVPAGVWSSASSMTFCLTESLCGGYDLKDIALKFYKWAFENYWTATGLNFDIGRTVLIALARVNELENPTECGLSGDTNCGNNSASRSMPLAFYLANEKDVNKKRKIIYDVSKITHSHTRCLIACDYYVEFLIKLINGAKKEEAYQNVQKYIIENYNEEYKDELQFYKRLVFDDISKAPEDTIKSSAYIVHTLEASIYSFMKNDDYKSAVLYAVNLGGDTDSIAAMTGALAGLYYGVNSISDEWIEQIAQYGKIMELLEKFSKSLNAI